MSTEEQNKNPLKTDFEGGSAKCVRRCQSLRFCTYSLYIILTGLFKFFRFCVLKPVQANEKIFAAKDTFFLFHIKIEAV